MLRTYKAILREGRIEWSEGSPPSIGPVYVHVTLLDDVVAVPAESGAAMAAHLDAIARRGGISCIPDPAQWQSEERADRPLPDRDK